MTKKERTATLPFLQAIESGEIMPWRPGFFEILLVLIIIVLLFGPGRISKITKELGASLTAFKEGLEGDDKKSPEKKEEDASSEKHPGDPV